MTAHLASLGIVPATPEHAIAVGRNMRPADAAEVWACARLTPEQAAPEALRISEYTWALEIDGETAAIFGVGSNNLLGQKGVPWLLTTDVVQRRPLPFARACGAARDLMLAIYPHIENWVDARHTQSVRWLRWMGATIHDATPYGPLGLPFHRFELTSSTPGESHA